MPSSLENIKRKWREGRRHGERQELGAGKKELLTDHFDKLL